MKNITFVLLLVFQFAAAVEKDSIITKNPFSKYLNTFEDDYYCDACGCSASGGSMGFASILNSNFIGVRYIHQLYKSRDGLYSNTPWYDENFNTVQAWARIPVFENVQVSALVPYHQNARQTETGRQSISGIGDMTVLAMYRLYQTHKDSTFLVHTLQVGGGLKIPTGKYDANNNGSVNPSFQLGTGSLDYILATEYVVKRKELGFNASVNYIFKTENQKFYRFGNQMNYAGTFFYLYTKGNYVLAPQLGFAGETYKSNFQHKQEVRNTAGDIFFSKLGFELGRNAFSFGANAMLPIHQNLTNGNVEAKLRWALNFNYSL